jgi:Protein of unknown function (DUF3768)
MSQDTGRIRALNDELRKDLFTGHAIITIGIAALGAEAFLRLAQTIAVFDDFSHANDPDQEHDFGIFDFDGHSVAFKIDYYDKTQSRRSPDPADNSVTHRIITIMLAEEI